MRRTITGIFALITFVMLSASVFAQNAPVTFDLEKFRETATRAETILQNDETTNQTLEEMRATLSTFRSQSLAEQETRAGRVSTVREQLAVLGDPPAEGEPAETPEVATRRDELNGQLAEFQAPLIVAQEAYRRAGSLIDQIDSIIRTRQSDTLLQLGPSPLNPKHWATATVAELDYFKGIYGEVKEAFSDERRSNARLSNAPATIVFVLLGLLLIFPASRWVSRKLADTTAKERNSRRAFSAFLLSLGLLIAPMIGFFLFVRGIELADILGARGDALRGYLPFIGLTIFGAIWIARNLFIAGGPGAQLLNIDQSRLKGGKRTVYALAAVFGLNYLIDAGRQTEDWPAEVPAVMQFPLIVAGAFGLYILARKFRNYRAGMTSEDLATANETLSGRISRLLTGFCTIVAFVGPAVAAIGYINLGANIVFSTLLSLALIATLFLLFALLVNILETFQRKPVALSDGEVSQGTAGGLYKSAVGFALICLALPVLAIIWGARVSDISDLWIQLREGISIGDTRFSISDFLSFVLIFSIGYTLTRLLQSALRTSVLPNTTIDDGAQNALVTGLGYIGIFLAALLAIMSTGLDLSNLAIVAGALSVGIGFGLQTIVSNFVSGIILLIERPIKLGDWVEVGAFSGYVRKISVRSTSVETFDRATVIIPNADLIGGTVTNWTHGNKHGRVIVPIGVGYGSDPRKIEEILFEIVKDHPMILKYPAPNVLFRRFGADSLDFEIRAILRDVNNMMSVASDLNYAIAERFKNEGIEIPFAQRDITIKNLSDLQKPVTAKKTTKKTSPKA
ncbi:mechanosensitive ion channel protein MscS [Amylibacter ulvae]|uniref:Mechanosensitive ion channel protein MscS n=1 Tax=Paramylibacter ulvae TaxID=1651968 RepID=A0ABQ3D7G8_9RHOB|nr:DUF3772 domain-containing protein [Amylibacter ulvae]GHA61568.1 mechanosensitive ion channel protein MscS [Amylibacter ulvae]